jgi:hypothetical protein
VIAGVILTLMLMTAPAAHATTPMIKIKTATVPGGKGSKIDVVVDYGCDPGSGVKAIVVVVHESVAQRREVEAYGDTKGRATATASCDGTAHVLHVLVTADNTRQWHSYMYDNVAAELTDAYDHTVVYDNQPQEWVTPS